MTKGQAGSILRDIMKCYAIAHPIPTLTIQNVEEQIERIKVRDRFEDDVWRMLSASHRP